MLYLISILHRLFVYLNDLRGYLTHWGRNKWHFRTQIWNEQRYIFILIPFCVDPFDISTSPRAVSNLKSLTLSWGWYDISGQSDGKVRILFIYMVYALEEQTLTTHLWMPIVCVLYNHQWGLSHTFISHHSHQVFRWPTWNYMWILPGFIVVICQTDMTNYFSFISPYVSVIRFAGVNMNKNLILTLRIVLWYCQHHRKWYFLGPVSI